jgi:hypothetical protein
LDDVTDQPPRQTPRQRYLEHRQRTQSLTFSITAMVMSLLVIVSLLVLMGIVKLPFGDEFSAGVDYAEVGDTPCPSSGSSIPDPSTVTVQVLNASSRQGVAGAATSMLQGAGFTTLDPGNADAAVISAVEIDAGPRAVDAAYAVARFFPDSRVTLTSSTDTTVTVVLGTFYEGALSTEEAQSAASDTAMSGGGTCLPVDPGMLAKLTADQSGQSGATQSGE